MNRFLALCHALNIHQPFPVTELLLCYFAAVLAQRGLAPATIRTYLAAVRHAQVVRGFPEPRQQSTLPRLRLVQDGARRVRAEWGIPQARSRLPITPAVLRQIRASLVGGTPDVDDIMVWAAATTCFFGFFRAGELTVPTCTAFNPAVHLAWGDVACDDGQPPTMVRLFLKRSKTDQFGRGVDVYLGATGDDLCPVAAVLAYVANRGDTPGPFFRLADGTPLTKARFVAKIRGALERAGIPPTRYAGHSFRIRAATAAATAGVQDSTTQALGRWSSSAFLRYIRTPREQLAQLSRTIARAPR